MIYKVLSSGLLPMNFSEYHLYCLLFSVHCLSCFRISHQFKPFPLFSKLASSLGDPRLPTKHSFLVGWMELWAGHGAGWQHYRCGQQGQFCHRALRSSM